MSTINDVVAAALSLPDGERASLAFQLLVSLRNPKAMSEDDAGVFEELERRSAACDRGEVTTSSWEEIAERVRAAVIR
jgi:putative addiction module component (TIGR02574 family)